MVCTLKFSCDEPRSAHVNHRVAFHILNKLLETPKRGQVGYLWKEKSLHDGVMEWFRCKLEIEGGKGGGGLFLSKL